LPTSKPVFGEARRRQRAEVVSAIHILVDLTLGLGRVVHDYLRQSNPRTLRINEMAFAT
jgi:acetoacetate decarboxylase